jgi:hypothetical protein
VKPRDLLCAFVSLVLTGIFSSRKTWHHDDSAPHDRTMDELESAEKGPGEPPALRLHRAATRCDRCSGMRSSSGSRDMRSPSGSRRMGRSLGLPGRHDRRAPPGRHDRRAPPGRHDRRAPPGRHDRRALSGRHDRRAPPGSHGSRLRRGGDRARRGDRSRPVRRLDDDGRR